MHRLLLALCVLVLLVTVSLVVAQQVTPQLWGHLNPAHPLMRGLVAWYPSFPPLAGGVTLWDVVGRNHGTFSGVATPPRPVRAGDPTGRFESAIRFDGADDSVSIPDASVLDFGTGNFSIVVWARPQSAAIGSYSLLQKTTFYENVAGWALELYYDTTTSFYVLFRITNQPDATPNTISSAVAFATDQTYSIAAIRSGQTLTLAVNGVPTGTGTSAAFDDDVNNAEPIQIGLSISSWLVWYLGSVANLMIYNRALTPADVTALAAVQAPEYGGLLLDMPPLALSSTIVSTVRKRVLPQ